MDNCGVFFMIVVLSFLVGIPFVLKSGNEQSAKLLELKGIYLQAKLTGETAQVVAAARAVLDEARRGDRLRLPVEAAELYRDILGMLKARPEYKPFALEVGRLAYGSRRKDWSPTVYDEQAILNDINAYS